MNGRVYDPFLGRMISADPTVPGALNSQAFNRYSYVLNNPLSLTDPSGFSPDHIGTVGRETIHADGGSGGGEHDQISGVGEICQDSGCQNAAAPAPVGARGFSGTSFLLHGANY
jgi:uncharacterized protein RhaS with RHS repeats